jgi:hypothetical protein
MRLLCDVISLEKAGFILTQVNWYMPVVKLGRKARLQQGRIVVELPQFALARLYQVPMQPKISTTTTNKRNLSDFSVSHRACSSNALQSDNKIDGDLRDLSLLLPG